MSECTLYIIIRMRFGVCLNALKIILLKWQFLYLNALNMTLLKWVVVYFWMLYIWYLENEGWCRFECCIYDITEMRGGIDLKAIYMLLLNWEVI